MKKNTFEQTDALRQEFKGTSDRAAAIVAGAYLDEILQEVLQSYLVKDSKSDKKIFQGTGPLSTFSAKIEMAYRLGLLSQWEYKSINSIRIIRNEFAHVLSDVSFNSQAIKAQCKNIELPFCMISPENIPMPKSDEIPPTPVIVKADSNNPRAVFQETVITLIHFLAARTALACRNYRVTPDEFTAAHEPLEVLVIQVKDLLRKTEKLTQEFKELSRQKDISSSEFTENNESSEKYRLLVSMHEFIVDQIKKAHSLPK